METGRRATNSLEKRSCELVWSGLVSLSLDIFVTGQFSTQ